MILHNIKFIVGYYLELLGTKMKRHIQSLKTHLFVMPIKMNNDHCLKLDYDTMSINTCNKYCGDSCQNIDHWLIENFESHH